MTKTTTDADFSDLPPTLRAERHGAVAVLKLARPEKRNALDDGTVVGIEAFFTTLFDVGYFPPNTRRRSSERRASAGRPGAFATTRCPTSERVESPSANVSDASFGLQCRSIHAPCWQLKHHRLLTLCKAG